MKTWLSGMSPGSTTSGALGSTAPATVVGVVAAVVTVVAVVGDVGGAADAVVGAAVEGGGDEVAATIGGLGPGAAGVAGEEPLEPPPAQTKIVQKSAVRGASGPS